MFLLLVSSLIAFWSQSRHCMSSGCFKFAKVFCLFLHSLEYGIIWWMLYVSLLRMCSLLLLDKVVNRWQFNPVDWWCCWVDWSSKWFFAYCTIHSWQKSLLSIQLQLEKTLESPLDCKEIQPVHSEGDQPWDVFGGNDAKAETPILWPPHVKSWLIGKDPDAGKDWGQEEKGTTEDEIVGWHHRLDRHGFGWTPGVGDGQGGLACCGSQRVRHEWATERNWLYIKCEI